MFIKHKLSFVITVSKRSSVNGQTGGRARARFQNIFFLMNELITCILWGKLLILECVIITLLDVTILIINDNIN